MNFLIVRKSLEFFENSFLKNGTLEFSRISKWLEIRQEALFDILYNQRKKIIGEQKKSGISYFKIAGSLWGKIVITIFRENNENS